MRSNTLHLAKDFWNIRGSFKIGGVIDIGTQASLVRRGNGRFVFLDSCSLSVAADREVSNKIAGFMENGDDVFCVEVEARGAHFWELNNPEDVPRIERVLAERGIE